MSTENNQEVTILLRTANPKQLDLYSLVLSAADIDHHIQAEESDWILAVSVEQYDLAHSELDKYIRENRYWPPSPNKDELFLPSFRAQSLLIIGGLLSIYAITGPWSAQSAWFAAGASDAEAVLQRGEYYRLLTSLTLHADLVHLLGNCFLGGVVMHFYFHIVGNGIGIFSLLTCSAIANYLNSLGHGPGHLSVGFSTAVFVVIGILCSLNFRSYGFHRPGRLLLPLMAAAAFLAMLGTGGERTDLGAHFYGLLTGLAAGLLLGIDALLKLRELFWLQFLLAATGMTVPVVAWYFALL